MYRVIQHSSINLFFDGEAKQKNNKLESILHSLNKIPRNQLRNVKRVFLDVQGTAVCI